VSTAEIHLVQEIVMPVHVGGTLGTIGVSLAVLLILISNCAIPKTRGKQFFSIEDGIKSYPPTPLSEPVFVSA